MKTTHLIFSAIFCFMMYVVSSVASEINQAMVDAGLVITQPGSWTLSESVTVQNAGITVQADNVKLDLQGNTIQAVGDVGTGIAVSSGVNNCAIQNGSLAGFSAAA